MNSSLSAMRLATTQPELALASRWPLHNRDLAWIQRYASDHNVDRFAMSVTGGSTSETIETPDQRSDSYTSI